MCENFCLCSKKKVFSQAEKTFRLVLRLSLLWWGSSFCNLVSQLSRGQAPGYRDHDFAQQRRIGLRAKFVQRFAHDFAHKFIRDFEHAGRDLFG